MGARGKRSYSKAMPDVGKLVKRDLYTDCQEFRMLRWQCSTTRGCERTQSSDWRPLMEEEKEKRNTETIFSPSRIVLLSRTAYTHTLSLSKRDTHTHA